MYQRVLELIDRHQDFLISGHVNPDGDCLGSQSALYHLLKDMARNVRVLNDGKPEPSYDYLAAHTPFEDHEAGTPLPPHQVHCLVDCNQLERLGSVGVEARKLDGVQRLVIDHHLGSDAGDGDLLLWDVEACSCGVLIYDLFRKAGAPLTREAGEGVFTSIVADTGWFRYSNTDDHALAIAADLVAGGVQPHRIYQALHMRRPRDSVRLISEALAAARLEEDGRLFVCTIPARLLREIKAADFNTDSLLDAMRAVIGVDVVLLLKDLGRKVKVSMRASDAVDVDGIAARFGGGGHKKAAGAEHPGPLETAEREVVEAIRSMLREGPAS